MIESKLIQTLKILSLSELKEFELYISSPFFNQHDKLIQFTKTILKHAPEFNGKELSKKEVFKKIFPKEPYNEQKVSDLMTYLFRHLNNYLTFIHFSKKQLDQKFFLLNELNERKANKNFNSLSAELSETIKNETKVNPEHFYHQYLLQTELDNYQIRNNAHENKNNLQDKSDSLDIFFIAAKLKDFCEMANRKNIVKTDFKMTMMEDLLEHINKHRQHYLNVPNIALYRQVLFTLTESDLETHFTELKILLKKHSQSLSKEEASMLYDYAQNYCIKKINSGNEKYYHELLNIYKSILEEKIIYRDGSLSPWDYKNIVTTAIRVKEFDWVKKFIEQHKNELPPEERENGYIYNMSSLHVAKGEYKEALKLLQKVEFTDVFYHLGAKSMMLRMYYELEETESFYSLCDTFKMYLIRSKHISKTQYENHFNLVKYSRKLFSIRESNNDAAKNQRLKKLSEEIKTKAIANMQWLLEKLPHLR